MEQRVDRLEKDVSEIREELRAINIMCAVTERDIREIKESTSHINTIYSKLDEVNRVLAKNEGSTGAFKMFIAAMGLLMAGATALIAFTEMVTK